MEEGCVYPFDENLGEVNVYFKTRGGVDTILIELRGGECNFPIIIWLEIYDINMIW